MVRTSLTSFALLALLAWTGQSNASDPVPPSNPVDAPTFQLDLDSNETDTELVHFYRRWGRGYGYYPRYGYSNYYPRYYSSYYYRPYYNGWGGGWGGYSNGWGGYYNGGWGGYYNGGWGGYYNGGWGGYYNGGWGGYGGWGCISDDSGHITPAITLGGLSCIPSPDGSGCLLSGGALPQIPQLPGQTDNSGEFNYDGGPSNPVPVPGSNPKTKAPSAVIPPQRAIPAKGLLVSLPGNPDDLNSTTFRAYGEQSPLTAAKQALSAASPSGFAYPAYGEQKGASSFGTHR